jgi:SpoU rRNA methylase family enzyme
MSDSDTSSFAGFGKLVPGFDFLQNLATQAASTAAQKIPQLPNLANWVAPTLNVEELDKRIDELKTVQFWLDQNAMALKATIQALEVQKMTLATLKGMNFNMGDVANAFKLKVSDSLAGSMQGVADKVDKAKTFAGLEIPPSTFQANKAAAEESADDEEEGSGEADEPAAKSKSAKPNGKDGNAVADPMQWWGALTQQFQAIATDAMKEAAKKTALDATRNVATNLAKDAMKTASDVATGIAKGMADGASKTVAAGGRAAVNSALKAAWPMPAATSKKASPRTTTKAAASRTAVASKPKTRASAAPAKKAASLRKPVR